MAFLSRAHELDKAHIPPNLAQDPAIVKAINAVDRMFDEEERAIYEVRMQALAEVESKIASALEKGLRKGRLECRQEGQEEEKRDMAHLMKNAGEIMDKISRFTGFSVDTIEKL